MLEIENCCLAVVDVQGKLAQLMHEKEKLFSNITILIKSAKLLNIPIIWCQQAPDALGSTILEIVELLPEINPINKTSFSCCNEPQFKNNLLRLNRRDIILCGIETHICIYQTAADLQRFGYQPCVITDAVSSRTEFNKTAALDKMKTMGINICSTEMILFELLKNANHENFKQIAKLVK
ncbi:MAG: hydrolase [Phycisphaerae bacterium]